MQRGLLVEFSYNPCNPYSLLDSPLESFARCEIICPWVTSGCYNRLRLLWHSQLCRHTLCPYPYYILEASIATKPRLFYKSAHLWVHSVDFYPGVNYTWQYYQTPKSAVISEQFHLQFNFVFHTSKSKWLPLAITLQLQSHCLEHPSIRSHISVTR